MDCLIKEQLVGGFVAPGGENVYEPKEQGPDFGNFIMCSQKLLDSGKTIGELIDKLAELPKPEPKERIPNNDYEYPQDALQTLPSFPG